MIVAVSAAPVVDRTELVQRLAAEHGLQPIEDPAPGLCASLGFQTLYDLPPELQRSSRERLLREHLEFVSHADGVILQFSAVEWLADWMRWCWSGTPTRLWAEILGVGEEILRHYTAIHHLEDGPPRSYDGYVWLDRENSDQVCSLMRQLHREFGIESKVALS